MKINLGEAVAALSIVGVAGAMVYIARDYPLGTLREMGPGYFPTMLGGATIILGAITLVSAVQSDAVLSQIPWRAFGLILAGMVGWAFLAERAGLIPASIALVLLTSVARAPFRPLSAILTALLASLFAAALFIYGFDLPLRPFKW